MSSLGSMSRLFVFGPGWSRPVSPVQRASGVSDAGSEAGSEFVSHPRLLRLPRRRSTERGARRSDRPLVITSVTAPLADLDTHHHLAN